ncbi:hypothetical protein Dimus_019101 [Dionaea muscipula]
MSVPTIKHLSSLFRSTASVASRLSNILPTPPPHTAITSDTIAEDAALKQAVSLLDTSSTPKVPPQPITLPPPPETQTTTETKTSGVNDSKKKVKKLKSHKPKQSAEDSISHLIVHSLNNGAEPKPGPEHKDLESVHLSDFQEVDDEKSAEKLLDLPWFSNLFPSDTSKHRKVLSRERKRRWTYKNTQQGRLSCLVTNCAERLGPDATLEVFGKLGKETGLKEYNTLIRLCIETARRTDDEEVAVEQFYKAYQVFKWMKEEGFQIEEETYGPFLMCLIDMHVTDEFYFFLPIIKDDSATSQARLGYYEMLLSIEMDDEDKIHELVSQITHDKCEHGLNLQDLAENYLLALGERGRKKEFLELLEVVDITKLPLHNIGSILKSLGRLSLQSFAEKLILAFKADGQGSERVSDFIYLYTTSMKNLLVEDIILKYKDMHAKLEVLPSSNSYEKLIEFCCDSLKVHLALDVVDQMCQAGFSLSTETLNCISHACEESSEFYLVRRIYSVLCCHNLKPNSETFRSMINSSVRMKDFDGAYDMLKGLEKMNLVPTTSMYNAIMVGFFREGHTVSGFRVLKQMEKADVKPDSTTYSYLIGNSECLDDIIKYFDEMKSSGVPLTKRVFMAMINAYATCGEFEKAKQVAFDKAVPAKNACEIKSALVAALASHGKISDALDIYEEMKQCGLTVEPKALISLLEYMQSMGELPRLLQILEQLSDPVYWLDGCCRVISYCIRYKDIESAVDLLKKLKDAFNDDEMTREVLFDEFFSQIADIEPSGLQIGLELLKSIKEDLKLHPSRKCLDFLLSACVKAKDARSSLLIWKEYELAGLPYNLLTSLKMYQALLASGDFKSAAKVRTIIPNDDPHVHSLLLACESTFDRSSTLVH